MLKKIPVSRLRPGMFVQELCGDWMSHPFWRAQFKLSSDAELRRIADSGIQHVYIDTDRGLDDVEAVAADVVKASVEQEIVAAMSAPDDKTLRVSVREEMSRARKVHEQAHKVVRSMMSDVRLGKAVSLEDAEPVVEAITGSVLRNSGALLGLIGIKNKDDYTFLHSVSVCTLMIAFGRSLGLAGEDLRQGGIGGLLHDLGKMKVPDEVLNKPGRLTDAEFELIKRHPGDGHAVLLETPGIEAVPLDITRHHHERLDGSGYPDRLAGDAISPMARMAAIVDVYDAITADRCYHKGMPAAEALRKMWEWSSAHFDQKLLQAFMRCSVSTLWAAWCGSSRGGSGWSPSKTRAACSRRGYGFSSAPNRTATSSRSSSTWAASWATAAATASCRPRCPKNGASTPSVFCWRSRARQLRLRSCRLRLSTTALQSASSAISAFRKAAWDGVQKAASASGMASGRGVWVAMKASIALGSLGRPSWAKRLARVWVCDSMVCSR